MAVAAAGSSFATLICMYVPVASSPLSFLPAVRLCYRWLAAWVQAFIDEYYCISFTPAIFSGKQ
jgi:hypothetical protein